MYDDTAPPVFHVEQSSPLDSLVRHASSRRAKVAKLADALNVPYTPPRLGQPTPEELGHSPSSPLLHTQFRGSVATYDGGSTADSSISSIQWESPGRRQEPSRRLDQASDERAVSMASHYSVDSYYDRVPSQDLSATAPPNIPTVVVSTDTQTQHYSHPHPTSQRTPITYPAGAPGPPPIGSEEQKLQVLMRNAHSHGGTSISSRRPSNASEKVRPTFQHSTSAPISRSHSQLSVYSSYSYYPYEGQLPSPSGSRNLSPTIPSPTIAVHPPSPPPPASPSGVPITPTGEPRTAQDFLQLGIQHHLANELRESASCFEKSATVGGGCGMGMLMWGLTQRHGWGIQPSESTGFRWLRKAAELAVDDLETGRAGVNAGAVKSELILAIYEVGQSFFRGWGVEKDKKMAVKYFKMAAELGDPDAQQELAFCLANGKGCKKDRKESAKWYRAAVAQGVSDVGLAWIYKEKFQ